MGIVEGVVWFVARRSRAPPFSLSGTPPLSVLAPFSTATSVHSSCQKGRGAPFHWGGGLARVCHSVMDDSTPTRSIRLPRACTCLGGETHPRLRALSLGSVANRAASDRSSGKANFFVGGGRVSSVDEERTIFQRTLFVDRGKEKERKRKIGKKLRRGNITGAREREVNVPFNNLFIEIFPEY